MKAYPVFFIILWLYLAISGYSEELFDQSVNEYSAAAPSKRYEVTFGGLYRFDEPEFIKSPALRGGVLYWFAGWGALQANLTYTPKIREKGKSNSYYSLSSKLGLYFIVQHKIISPFVVSGISITRYATRYRAVSAHDNKTGLFFGAGLSCNVMKNVNFDISIEHTIEYIYIGYTCVSYQHDIPHGLYLQSNSNQITASLYNPTTISLTIRTKL